MDDRAGTELQLIPPNPTAVIMFTTLKLKNPCED